MKVLSKLLLLYFTCITLMQTKLYAAPMSEIQEVRLAKVELAILDGKLKQALKLLNKNLSAKNFHLPSFLFLARYHYKNGHYSKSFRVFYYVIKRLHGSHGKKIINLKKVDNINDDLKDLSPPSREALKVYFEIAQLYFQLSEEKKFSRELNEHLVNLSAKFYNICAYYRYSLPQTNYFLAIVQGKRKNFQKAIDHYVEAKDLFEKEENPENKQQIENIEFLLGDSLIKEGYTDAGTLFLKSLYLSSDANPSLKEYANAYLDALSADFLSFSASYNINYNNNINRLTSEELANFDPETKFRESAILHEKNFNAFYSASKFKRNWNYLLSLNLSEENVQDQRLANNDSRSLSAGLELKYDNLVKSIAKLTYTYDYAWFKAISSGEFGKLTTSHSITPQYIHTLKRGALTYKLPLIIFDNVITGSGFTKGFSLSYTPFWRNRWFAPTGTIGFNSVDEGELIEKSSQFSFTASNHFSYSDRLSIFTFLSLIQNSNPDPDNDFFQYSLSFSGNYLIKWIKNLSLNVSLSHSTTDEKVDGAIHVQSFTTGLSYFF